MTNYGPNELKSQIPELSQFDDFTLVPIFDRVVDRLSADMSHTPMKYGLTDAQSKYASSSGLDRYFCPSYTCVVDGRIVDLTFREQDIDIKDEDEFWYMTSRIDLMGDSQGVEKLLGGIREYVSTLNPMELKSEAAQRLLKGKVYHLDEAMRNFYISDLPDIGKII